MSSGCVHTWEVWLDEDKLSVAHLNKAVFTLGRFLGSERVIFLATQNDLRPLKSKPSIPFSFCGAHSTAFSNVVFKIMTIIIIFTNKSLG